MRAAPFLLALAALAAGCGGKSGSGAGTTSAERASWAREVNAACLATRRAIEAIGAPSSAAAARAAVPRVRSAGRSFLARVEAARPAPGDEARVAEMLAEYRRAVRLEGDALDALVAGDGPRLVAVQASLRRHGARGDAIARELGAAECSKAPRLRAQ